MSYRTEDWQYVAEILNRSYQGWGISLVDEPTLPAKKDVIREIRGLSSSCEECNQISSDDAQGVIDSIDLDESSEYIDRLQRYGSSAFEKLGNIQKICQIFLDKNQEVPDEIQDLIADIQYEAGELCQINKNLGELFSIGVILRGMETSKILGFFPDWINLTYTERNNLWKGSYKGIVLEVLANNWCFMLPGEWSMYTDKGEIYFTTNSTKGTINPDMLEDLFPVYHSPTQQEKEMASMLYPQYKEFFDIYCDVLKNIKEDI